MTGFRAILLKSFVDFRCLTPKLDPKEKRAPTDPDPEANGCGSDDSDLYSGLTEKTLETGII